MPRVAEPLLAQPLLDESVATVQAVAVAAPVSASNSTDSDDLVAIVVQVDSTVADGITSPGVAQSVEMVEARVIEFGDGCWEGFKKSPHLKSLICAVAVLGLLVVMVVQAMLRCGLPGVFRPQNYMTQTIGADGFPLWLAVLIAWFLYTCEWLSSNSLRYLRNMQTAEAAAVHVLSQRQQRPIITWRVQCYHYETETYEVTDTDAEGNTTTRTETRQVRVDTHSAQCNYKYSSCTDVSSTPPSFDTHMVTKITFKKCYSFDSPQSRMKFLSDQRLWRGLHDRDDHQDFCEHMSIPGFVPKMLGELAPELRPRCLSPGWFVCASCTLCSPLWRWWFGSIAVNTEYVVHKQLTCN